MTAGSWRESDLRGGWGPRPTSVRAVVQRAHWGLRAARWGETALFFGAGVCVCLSAAVLSGATLGSFETWVVAGIGAFFFAASWFYEQRTSLGELARRLDRRMRHQGALVTAFELEGARAPEPMAELLSSRVLERLRTPDALRCVLPSILLPVVVPILAFCVLALALELARTPELQPVELSELGRGMAAELDAAAPRALGASEVGELEAETVGRFVRAKARAQELARELESAEPDPQALEGLARLDQELAELEPLVSDVPELRRSLESARAWLDATREGLERGLESARRGDSSPELAAGVPDATMVGSNSSGVGSAGPSFAPSIAPEGPPRSLPDGPPRPERASPAGEVWAPAYRPIVAGWIELRRASRAEPR